MQWGHAVELELSHTKALSLENSPSSQLLGVWAMEHSPLQVRAPRRLSAEQPGAATVPHQQLLLQVQQQQPAAGTQAGTGPPRSRGSTALTGPRPRLSDPGAASSVRPRGGTSETTPVGAGPARKASSKALLLGVGSAAATTGGQDGHSAAPLPPARQQAWHPASSLAAHRATGPGFPLGASAAYAPVAERNVGVSRVRYSLGSVYREPDAEGAEGAAEDAEGPRQHPPNHNRAAAAHAAAEARPQPVRARETMPQVFLWPCFGHVCGGGVLCVGARQYGRAWGKGDATWVELG
jgi:hypothetical protein